MQSLISFLFVTCSLHREFHAISTIFCIFHINRKNTYFHRSIHQTELTKCTKFSHSLHKNLLQSREKNGTPNVPILTKTSLRSWRDAWAGEAAIFNKSTRARNPASYAGYTKTCIQVPGNSCPLAYISLEQRILMRHGVVTKLGMINKTVSLRFLFGWENWKSVTSVKRSNANWGIRL